MKSAAESLVIRARAGDQNAIAMIMRVRDGVRHSRRAALAYDLLRNFVKKNPVGKAVSPFGFAGSGRSSYAAIASSAKKQEPKGYSSIVRWIEKLPTDLDRYAEASFLVADGRPVDAAAVKWIIPALRGSVIVAGELPVSFGEARAKGFRIAEDWEVQSDARGNLRITPAGGHPIGFPLPGKAVSSVALFAAAFNRATRADAVQKMAGPLPTEHRQPLRVGYVMGLAHAIQSVVRRGVPIKTLSENAAWELGEE
jgi:hypothetical protein